MTSRQKSQKRGLNQLRAEQNQEGRVKRNGSSSVKDKPQARDLIAKAIRDARLLQAIKENPEGYKTVAAKTDDGEAIIFVTRQPDLSAQGSQEGQAVSLATEGQNPEVTELSLNGTSGGEVVTTNGVHNEEVLGGSAETIIFNRPLAPEPDESVSEEARKLLKGLEYLTAKGIPRNKKNEGFHKRLVNNSECSAELIEGAIRKGIRRWSLSGKERK